MGEWDDYKNLPQRFIDLRKSVLDEEQSDVKKNIYKFKEKTYYNKVENPFPGGVFKWGRKTDNIKSAGIFSKLQRYGYYKINIQEHQVLPEPFSPINVDESGDVVYVDGLLCAIPYYDLAKKRKREVEKADRNLQVSKLNFEKMLGDYGAQLSAEDKEKLNIT